MRHKTFLQQRIVGILFSHPRCMLLEAQHSSYKFFYKLILCYCLFCSGRLFDDGSFIRTLHLFPHPVSDLITLYLFELFFNCFSNCVLNLKAVSFQAKFWCFWHRQTFFGCDLKKNERDTASPGFSWFNFLCRLDMVSFKIYFCAFPLPTFTVSFFPGIQSELSSLFKK